MNRELAILFALCMLLGTGFASTIDQPEPWVPVTESGTRAIDPGLAVMENITQNTTWDNNIYPYIHVKRNIWVKEGITLTVKQGVTVRFDANAGLNIKGRIVANGAPFYEIRFIPSINNPAPGHWKGITLQNGTAACIFNYAAVRYSTQGIAAWGTEATITNSTIEYTHLSGVFVGTGSRMLIRNNYINFTTWAGIITDNRSMGVVENNFIRTSNYGVVCYDKAEIKNNDIRLCWLGILAWGDANITRNQIRDCMDGIHAFFASPVIEENLIISCDGNGTRFFSSNAIMRNNRLAYNYVGMDIDYGSRHLLATMDNNTVNEIDIKDCFFVGERDLVIENLLADSGASKKYYGSLTAQGSVTLYDCRNVTIRNSTIINTVNSVYATNSTFTIYNSTFDNARRAQVFLEANATGTGFNRSVNPERVMIGGDNCLFQTLDSFSVGVLDFYGEPVLGAMVIVKEGQLMLHDTITGLDGQTPNMVVKDRTVSESGIIPSPLSVEVISPGHNFDPNPRTGVYVSQTSHVTFKDLGDIFPPVAQSISIQDGDRAFPVNGNITIQFNEPMNRTSAESAFSITGNVTGTFSWDGLNMTFTPDHLDYNSYYTVVISTGAMDMWNNSLESPISFSFTTAHAPSSGGYYILAAAIAIFAVAGVAGWIVLKKLR